MQDWDSARGKSVLFSRTLTLRHRFKDWRWAIKQLSRISRLNVTLGRTDSPTSYVLFSDRKSHIVSNNNRHLLPITTTTIIIIGVPYVRYFIIFLQYYTVITTVRQSYTVCHGFVCENVVNISFLYTKPRNVFEQRHTQVNTEGAFYLLLFFSLFLSPSVFENQFCDAPFSLKSIITRVTSNGVYTRDTSTVHAPRCTRSFERILCGRG